MIIIGIAGGSGSGKTTFANKVLENVQNDSCAILHMDSYYKPNPQDIDKSPKGRANFDHPQAFDWKLLTEHLKALKEGLTIEIPNYSFNENKRLEQTTTLKKCEVILFEGIFTLYDESIRKILDIKCFLHVEADTRFTRRLHRDVKERGRSLESVIDQYYDTVRPMYQKYLEPQRQYADFIVGEETSVAANILASHINSLLSSKSSFTHTQTEATLNQ